MRIELLSSVTSTNDYIEKYLASGEDVIVCADVQTGGKGTKGRSFLSEKGGIYLSALTFYRDFSAKQAFRVMTHAAVSVCRTAEAFGVTPEIKWPNDVFAAGKKLSGILIRTGVENGLLAYSIVGIGLNVNNALTGLETIAIGLSRAAGKLLDERAVREELIRNIQMPSDFQEYIGRVRFLGKQVRVMENGECYVATAVRILQDGRLEVARGGEIRRLSAAEISINWE